MVHRLKAYLPVLKVGHLVRTRRHSLRALGKPCLLCEYGHAEVHLGERVVVKNAHFVALVPWWATWPFETLCKLPVLNMSMTDINSVMPYKRHISSLNDLTQVEKSAFAEIISKMTKRYDNLFQTSFAYSMGVHQQPVPGSDDEGNVAHLHLHFSPPLLRSATVRKFLVGQVNMYFHSKLIEAGSSSWLKRKGTLPRNKQHPAFRLALMFTTSILNRVDLCR